MSKKDNAILGHFRPRFFIISIAVVVLGMLAVFMLLNSSKPTYGILNNPYNATLGYQGEGYYYLPTKGVFFAQNTSKFNEKLAQSDITNITTSQASTSTSYTTSIAYDNQTTTYTTIPSANSNFYIQTSFYKNSTLGDGYSSIVIPITLFDAKTNEPLTVPIQVQAQTNVGSVSTECSAPSVCDITFTPPQTLQTEYAQVSIDAGGTIKTISIEVMTAPPNFISIYTDPHIFTLSSTALIFQFSAFGVPCYSRSSQNFSKITVNAYDKNDKGIPDGSVLNFSANTGIFSNSSCVTKDDSCSVLYNPLAAVRGVGNISIYVSSYNISSSANITVVSDATAAKLTGC